MDSFSQYHLESGITNKGEPAIGDVGYLGLAFAGEAGEVANEIKKLYRDDKGHLTMERRQKILSEMGDCLWYMSRLAEKLGMTLAEVAEDNVRKLHERYNIPRRVD